MKKIILMASLMLMGVVHSMNAQNETNDCGTLIIPVEYDDIRPINNSMLVVTKDKKKGVIDAKGKTIAPVEFDEIEPGNNSMLVVTKDKKKGVVDSNGKTIVPVRYDDVELGREGQNCGGLVVVVNNLEKRSEKVISREHVYGLYNKDGVQIVPMDKYDKIKIGDDDYGFEGMAEVLIFNGETKFIDAYDGLFFEKGTVMEHRGTKCGVRLVDGTVLDSYDGIEVERGGLIEVQKDRRKGVLNKKGEVIVPIKYNDVYIEADGKFIEVVTPYQDGGNKCGVYNNKGEVIVPIGKYESVNVCDKYIKVEKGGKKGILNQKGVEIVPIGRYEECYESSDDGQYYIEIKTNKKEGAVNDNGKVFIPIGKYEYFGMLNTNLALVEMNKKKGLIDKNGTVIVPIGKYNDLNYQYGVLSYSQNGKWGFLDKNGKQATPAQYDKIKPQRHSIGMALVAKGDKTGMADCNGKIIMPLDNYTDGDIEGSIGFFKKDEKRIVFSTDGKILAPLGGKYKSCGERYGEQGYELKPFIYSPDGLYIVRSNGKIGVLKLW